MPAVFKALSDNSSHARHLWIIRLSLLAFIIATAFLKPFMLLYEGVMLLSLEFLNRRPEHLSKPYYKLSDYAVLCYILFIFINRNRHPSGNASLEELINRIEHFLFACVISLHMLRYLGLKLFRLSNYYVKLIITFAAFNLAGVANEVYQAMLGPAPFTFSTDARSDMLTNLFSSGFFLSVLFFLQLLPKNPISQYLRFRKA